MRFPPSVLLPDFATVTKPIQVGSSTGLILGSNPNRVTLLFWPRSLGQWVVGPAPVVASGMGFRVDFTSSPLAFDFATYGHLITAEWYGVSLAGPFTAYVSEVTYNPR